jgi:hypothetical protein
MSGGRFFAVSELLLYSRRWGGSFEMRLREAWWGRARKKVDCTIPRWAPANERLEGFTGQLAKPLNWPAL